MTTDGVANATQSVRMGVYHRRLKGAADSRYSSRPVYVHNSRQEFLFYVDGRKVYERPSL